MIACKLQLARASNQVDRRIFAALHTVIGVWLVYTTASSTVGNHQRILTLVVGRLRRVTVSAAAALV